MSLTRKALACSRHPLATSVISNCLMAAGAGGAPRGSRCAQWRWAAAKTCRQAAQLRRRSSMSTSQWARTPRAGTRCTAGPRGRPAGPRMRPRPARPPRPSRTAPARGSWSLGGRGCVTPLWCSMLPTARVWGAHAGCRLGGAMHMPSAQPRLLQVRSAHRACQKAQQQRPGACRRCRRMNTQPHARPARKAGATKKVSSSGSRPSRTNWAVTPSSTTAVAGWLRYSRQFRAWSAHAAPAQARSGPHEHLQQLLYGQPTLTG